MREAEALQVYYYHPSPERAPKEPQRSRCYKEHLRTEVKKICAVNSLHMRYNKETDHGYFEQSYYIGATRKTEGYESLDQARLNWMAWTTMGSDTLNERTRQPALECIEMVVTKIENGTVSLYVSGVSKSIVPKSGHQLAIRASK